MPSETENRSFAAGRSKHPATEKPEAPSNGAEKPVVRQNQPGKPGLRAVRVAPGFEPGVAKTIRLSFICSGKCHPKRKIAVFAAGRSKHPATEKPEAPSNGA